MNYNNPVDIGARIRELQEQLTAAQLELREARATVDSLQAERLVAIEVRDKALGEAGALLEERDHAREQRDAAERKLSAARDLADLVYELRDRPVRPGVLFAAADRVREGSA